ncbi:MAG: hypothetical protein FWC68_04215 [Oscillospiraceae bacterium]|nr:hypothetical protein [Oscillospiraceae bacterium]
MGKGKRVKSKREKDDAKPVSRTKLKRNAKRIVVVLIIIGVLWYIFDSVEIVDRQIQTNFRRNTNVEGTDEEDGIENVISEEQALEIALIEFERLGEEGLKKENLKLIEARLYDVDFFIILSPLNQIEMFASDGEIYAINGEVVEYE